jgi:phosphoribosylaminoimidazole-succinocarboxamide synthase
VELLHRGKVRDIYSDRPGELLLVATDRVSVYDVVLPTPIPDKGKLLTALSLWWFEQFADLVPNHVISATDVPAEFAGRAIRCRRLDMVPAECIVRGYLTGQGLTEYQRHGSVSGLRLPAGLVEAAKLPIPIFTPTTKAPVGSHDEFLTFDEVVKAVGIDTANEMENASVRVYLRGSELAAERGIIIADTKLEFGLIDGEPLLIDELLTPDSSRFWEADRYEPGRPQDSLDKQPLRDWLTATGWDREPPAPPLPPEVVARIAAKYAAAYERLTGLRVEG